MRVLSGLLVVGVIARCRGVRRRDAVEQQHEPERRLHAELESGHDRHPEREASPATTTAPRGKHETSNNTTPAHTR